MEQLYNTAGNFALVFMIYVTFKDLRKRCMKFFDSRVIDLGRTKSYYNDECIVLHFDNRKVRINGRD